MVGGGEAMTIALVHGWLAWAGYAFGIAMIAALWIIRRRNHGK